MKDVVLKYTCIGIASVLMVGISDIVGAQVIYGLDKAQHFNASRHGPFTVQAGSFRNEQNAHRLKEKLAAQLHYAVHVKSSRQYYLVLIGPLSSSSIVREVGSSQTTHFAKITQQHTGKINPKVTHAPLARKPAPLPVRPTALSTTSSQLVEKTGKTMHSFDQFIPTKTNWYAGIGVGGQFPTLNSSVTVHNGSDFPVPLNQDVYSTSNNSQVFLGVSAGRRWQNNNFWLSALSFGVLYEHFFSNNAGGTVMQYSLPSFTNYNYGWNITSNAVLATAKLNLFRYAQWSPFINGGIGGAFNTASGFNETALAGVTPRVSPGFASNTRNQFAYNAGAGLDFQLAPHCLISVGYLYQDLGSVSSGKGAQTWAGESLSLGSYRSNEVFASVTYLFGK